MPVLEARAALQARVTAHRLAICSVPSGDRDLFIDYTATSVARFIAARRIVPQRPVYEANVRKLAESLSPGALAMSLRAPGAIVLFPLDFWTDQVEREAVSSARRELFRLITRPDALEAAEVSISQTRPPPSSLRTTDAVSIDADLARACGFYIADGNHRVAVFDRARRLRESTPSEQPYTDEELRLYFEVFSEDVMSDPVMYLSVSVERNQVASLSAIRQFRHLPGTVALVRLARLDPYELGAAHSDGAVYVNDFGSFAVARYRFELLERASRHHPIASFLLENLGEVRFHQIMGYGKNGFGPGCVFVLMALEETARWYGIIDPEFKLLGSMAIFKTLSRRLNTVPTNPLCALDAAEDNSSRVTPSPSVVTASSSIGNIIKTWKRSTGLKNEPEDVCEEAFRLGEVLRGVHDEAHWTTTPIDRPPVPVIGLLIDLGVLIAFGDTPVIDLTTGEERSGPRGTPGRRKAGTKSKARHEEVVRALSRDIARISRAWMRPLAQMLEVVVPLVHPASPPLKPPRVDWHDPFILLHLLADAHARERAESDPFAPGSAETARFDTIPPRPFLETAEHAAIAQSLAAFVWAEREGLLAEVSTAMAWAELALRPLPPVIADHLSATCTVFLPLAPLAAGDSPADADDQRFVVWNYPSHHRLARKIEDAYGSPGMILGTGRAAEAALFDPETLPVKSEKAAGPSIPDADTHAVEDVAAVAAAPGRDSSAPAVENAGRPRRRRTEDFGVPDEGPRPRQRRRATRHYTCPEEDQDDDDELDDASVDGGRAALDVEPAAGTCAKKGPPGTVGEKHDRSGRGAHDIVQMVLIYLAARVNETVARDPHRCVAYDIEWHPDVEPTSKLGTLAHVACIHWGDGAHAAPTTIIYSEPGQLASDAARPGSDIGFTRVGPTKVPDLRKLTPDRLALFGCVLTILTADRTSPAADARIRTSDVLRDVLADISDAEHALKRLQSALIYVAFRAGEDRAPQRIAALKFGTRCGGGTEYPQLGELPDEFLSCLGSSLAAGLAAKAAFA